MIFLFPIRYSIITLTLTTPRSLTLWLSSHSSLVVGLESGHWHGFEFTYTHQSRTPIIEHWNIMIIAEHQRRIPTTECRIPEYNRHASRTRTRTLGSFGNSIGRRGRCANLIWIIGKLRWRGRERGDLWMGLLVLWRLMLRVRMG